MTRTKKQIEDELEDLRKRQQSQDEISFNRVKSYINQALAERKLLQNSHNMTRALKIMIMSHPLEGLTYDVILGIIMIYEKDFDKIYSITPLWKALND